MKFVTYDGGKTGLIKGDGVVDISSLCSGSGQAAMASLISNYDSLKGDLEKLGKDGTATPLSSVKLNAPLPRPSKILAMGGNFLENGAKQPAPMWGFTKSLDAVLAPGGTVVLPDVDANIFHHEAELVLVFGKNGKDIKSSEAMDYVFGYTCGLDVSARIFTGTPAAPRVPNTLHISPAKSYDTFAPMGPYIVTKDEITNPQHLHVELRVDGELRGDYNTDDMGHSIEDSIEFVSSIEAVSPGDVLYLGTNHQGLGAMQDGDSIEITIEQVGNFSFNVSDPLKRRWAKGVDEETAKNVREGTSGPGRNVRPL
jgi:2-keto-4-pentenoate hydratase/2-oxohepta-3-ene-1,7-dioic acid hydratase in catechol pathway